MPDLTDEAFALSDALVAVYAEMAAAQANHPVDAEHLGDLLEQAEAIGRRQDENDALRFGTWAMGEAA